MAALSANLGRGESYTSGITGRPTTYRRTWLRNEDKMARYIFIVSLRHGALYDYLLQRFSDDPNAQVILDRRRAERRQAEISVVLEIRAKQGAAGAKGEVDGVLAPMADNVVFTAARPGFRIEGKEAVRAFLTNLWRDR